MITVAAKTVSCRKCNRVFEPRASQIAKSDFICRRCCADYHRKWRKAERSQVVPPLERYLPVTESGCWLFEGAWSHRFGYGSLRIGGKNEGAHRVFYRAYKGEIPPGLFVCHKCDTPSCVNPEHLFLGTLADNHRDRAIKGRYDGPMNPNWRGGINRKPTHRRYPK